MNRSRRTWAAATPEGDKAHDQRDAGCQAHAADRPGDHIGAHAATYPPAVGDGAGAVPCGCGGFRCLSFTGRWGP